MPWLRPPSRRTSWLCARPNGRRKGPVRPAGATCRLLAEPQEPAPARPLVLAGWPGPMLVAAVVGWFWMTGGRYVSTDNAYVQADTVDVATDVDGLVKRIEVQDNQHVSAGRSCSPWTTPPIAAPWPRPRPMSSSPHELEAHARQLRAERGRDRQGQSDVAYFEGSSSVSRARDARVKAQMQLDAARHNLDARIGSSRARSKARRHRGAARRRPRGADRAASALSRGRGRAGPGAHDFDTPWSGLRSTASRRACRRCSRVNIWIPGSRPSR